MKEIKEDILAKEQFMLFIHTPFCGTCQLARMMLDQIESVHKKDIFHEMNASLHPKFMQSYKIESVPCLLFKKDNEIKEKIYAFHSTANIYHYLIKYASDSLI